MRQLKILLIPVLFVLYITAIIGILGEVEGFNMFKFFFIKACSIALLLFCIWQTKTLLDGKW